jgi:hypothetical protein
VVIPDCQFIKKMRQVISIRYASTRIVINFIKNTHISTLRIMHPLGGGQLLRRLPIKIISGTFIGSSIQLFHRYYLHELAGHPRLVFIQSLPRLLPYRGAHMLGLVRAGIAGDRNSRDVYCLHPATCNSCTQRTLSCHQHIALSTNRLRIEYDEHAERTYIAEIDEGPNSIHVYYQCLP